MVNFNLNMKKRKLGWFITGVLLLISNHAPAQKISYADLLKNPPSWVDYVFKKLSKKQKIAQMFFVRAHTNLGQAYMDSVGKVIRREKLGGVVFFQGGPVRQAALANAYQKRSKIPLIIASDGEWGLGMRLDSAVSYPYQMTLGAIQNKTLLYKMGRQIAKDYKRMGIHMNFAPVVDINNNAKNPVINYRSFGENKHNVAEKAAAYLKGMQDEGLLTTIKHFPGHGDTDVDSHYDLPRLKFSKERLDSLEMYPFNELIKQDATGVMVAHMNIFSLDSAANLPASLSKPIITGLLKTQIGFKGLVVSDAMDMKGAVKYFKDGEAEIMGVIAGNDILELSQNSKRAIKMIKRAIKNKRIDMERINESVKKILSAKYYANLTVAPQIDLTNLVADINREESLTLLQQLADASITLLCNVGVLENLTPKKRTVIINAGTPELTTFQKELAAFYKNSVCYNINKNAAEDEIAKIKTDIMIDDQVIIGIFDTKTRPSNGLIFNANVVGFLADMAKNKAAFAFFANPYNLANFPGLEQSKCLLMAYQKEDFMQKAAAAVFKGVLIPSGKLPVTVNQFFKCGDGL